MRTWHAVAGFLCIIAIIIATIFMGGEPADRSSVNGVEVRVKSGEVKAVNGMGAERKIGQGKSLSVGSDGKLGTPKPSEVLAGIQDATSSVSGTIAAASSAMAARIKLVTNAQFWISGYSKTDEDQPLAGTTVSAYNRHYGEKRDKIVSVQTNDQGYYAIEFPKEGKIYLLAEPKEGFSEAESYLTLNATDTEDQIDFVHYPAGFSLRGKVFAKETQEPVGGAELKLGFYPIRREFYDRYNPKSTSNDDGTFLIKRVPKGNYNLQVQAKGYLARDPKPWENENDPLGNIRVDERSQSREVLVELEPGASVVARVYTPEGKPLPGALVQLGMKNKERVEGSWGRTNEQGVWRTDCFYPGKAIAIAQMDPYGLTISDEFETGTLDNPAEIEITMTEAASISGKVTMKDGGPAYPYLLFGHNETLKERIGHSLIFSDSSVSTKEDGTYTLDNLAAGKYQISVFKKNDSGGYSGRDVLVTKKVTIEQSQHLTDFDIQLDTIDANEVVRGRLVDQDDRPITQGKVYIYIFDSGRNPDMPGCRGEASPNEAGEFEITGLVKAANFHLTTDVKGYKRILQQYDMNGEYLTVRLEEAGSIEGLVLDKNSKKVVPAIQLQLKCSDPNVSDQKAISGDDGSFLFENTPTGTYRIIAIPKDYARVEVKEIVVKAGQVTDNVIVEVETGLTIKGRLVAPDGSPVAGASVGLLGNRLEEFHSFYGEKQPAVIPNSVASGADGLFELPNVPSGGDTLVIRPRRLAPRLFPITPSQIGNEPITIPLVIGGGVEGTAVDQEGKPYVDEEIGLFDEPDQLFVLKARTNEEGYYKIEHAPAQSMIVMRFGTQSHLDRDYKRVSIRDGEMMRVDFGNEGATVQGMVTRSGQPAPDAIIVIERYDHNQFRRFGTSDANGHYKLTGIPPGEYLMLFATQLKSYILDISTADGQYIFQVDENQKEYTIDLSVFEVKVEGIVKDKQTGAPIAGADIRPLYTGEAMMADPMFNKISPTKSLEDGTFQITLNEPGSIRMIAGKTGYFNQEFTLTFDPATNPGGSAPIATEVLLNSAETVVEALLTFNGQPVNPDRIYFVSYTNGLQEFPATPDPVRPGVYRITGMNAGPVTIKVMGMLGNEAQLQAMPAPFVARENETTPIAIPLYDTIEYKILFKTKDGGPVSIRPGACHIEIPNFPDFSRSSDALMIMQQGGMVMTGMISCSVPKGPHAVRIHIEGYQPVEFVPTAIAEAGMWPYVKGVTLELVPE